MPLGLPRLENVPNSLSTPHSCFSGMSAQVSQINLPPQSNCTLRKPSSSFFTIQLRVKVPSGCISVGAARKAPECELEKRSADSSKPRTKTHGAHGFVGGHTAMARAIGQLEGIDAGAPIAEPLTREQAINIATERIGLFESVLRPYGRRENGDRR